MAKRKAAAKPKSTKKTTPKKAGETPAPHTTDAADTSSPAWLELRLLKFARDHNLIGADHYNQEVARLGGDVKEVKE